MSSKKFPKRSKVFKTREQKMKFIIAHKMTRKICNSFAYINYKSQFKLCLTFVNTLSVNHALELFMENGLVIIKISKGGNYKLSSVGTITKEDKMNYLYCYRFIKR